MPKNQAIEDVIIDRRTLCIVLDETGQEEFKNTQQVFGLGGVAGFGIQLMHAERCWRRMKQKHFGGEDQPLHGSGKKMTSDQMSAISEFFESSRLPRFAFLLRKPDKMPKDYNALHVLRPFLLEQFINFIGDRDELPKEIVVVFERSQRLEPKLKEVFPGLNLQVDGKEIQVLGVLQEKSPEAALLEMADQVTWRAQRQREDFSKTGTLYAEFVSVFPRGALYSRYHDLTAKIESQSG